MLPRAGRASEPSPLYFGRRRGPAAATLRLCHDAPRKEGRAAPLRLALESAPTASFLPRGLQSNVADRRNRAALLALLQADPHAAADDDSLLQLACEKGYLDLAAALLSHGGVLGPGAPPGRPAPLHAAAEAGDRAPARAFLAAAARAGGASAVRSRCSRPGKPKAAERIARKPTAGSEKLLKKLAAAQADHVEQEEQGGAYAVHCAVRGKADDCVELLLDALRDPAMVSPTPLPDDGDDAHRPRHYRDAPLGSSLLHEAAFRQAPQCLERLLRHGGFDVSSKAQFKPVGIVTPLEVAVPTRRPCVRRVVAARRRDAVGRGRIPRSETRPRRVLRARFHQTPERPRAGRPGRSPWTTRRRRFYTRPAGTGKRTSHGCS